MTEGTLIFLRAKLVKTQQHVQQSCRTLTEMASSGNALKSLFETPALPRHADAAVCAGRESHKTPLIGAAHTLEDISQRSAPSPYVLDFLRETRALKQLGTLGGGNHFLEVSIFPVTLQTVMALSAAGIASSNASLLPNKSGCQISEHSEHTQHSV